MKCKHPYYRMVDGVLVCVQCGEPSTRHQPSETEDKIAADHEVKQQQETTAAEAAETVAAEAAETVAAEAAETVAAEAAAAEAAPEKPQKQNPKKTNNQ